MIGPKGEKRPKSIPASTRRKLLKRSGGLCEGCGSAPAAEIHHRQYLSRGGRHNLANLLHLCGWGNHTGCHGAAHGATPPLGHSVRSNLKSILEPVSYRGVKSILDDEGTVTSDYRVVF